MSKFLSYEDRTTIAREIKKLNNHSPYETFSFYYGEDVLKKLGYSPVAPRTKQFYPHKIGMDSPNTKISRGNCTIGRYTFDFEAVLC